MIFYFLKKPRFHIYKAYGLTEISIGWLNFIFAREKQKK